jgi:hypothetical protein
LRGRTDFMQRASHYIALRRKEDWLEVCHHDKARWIHADAALPNKRRM